MSILLLFGWQEILVMIIVMIIIIVPTIIAKKISNQRFSEEEVKQLERLSRMRKNGDLSQKEFEKQKRKIINRR